MKILFSSHVFPPDVGGLEAVSLILAREFTHAGHEVRVATQTPAAESRDTFGFEVVRRPSFFRLLQMLRWSDVVFHNNISLSAAWPLLLVRRPWVVAHHMWVSHHGVKSRLKRLVLRAATGIAVSDAMAMDFVTTSVTIPNPYDATTFRLINGVSREQALVFVGRFVDDKGLPVLLQALQRLAARGLQPELTVVGAGPAEKAWRAMVIKLGLSEQVEFIGVKRGRELAELLNAHRVLVVPSIWQEPFGIVALEGIACGCLVVGSEGGGLKAAIGPAGITFPNGDAHALAERLVAALTDMALMSRCRAAAPAHLAAHLPAAVARRYLDVFSTAIAMRSLC